MKLLLDQNLSHRLTEVLRAEYPESRHVRDVGLSQAPDEAVWQYAAQQGFTVVTKDADFHPTQFLVRPPALSDLDSAWQLLDFGDRAPIADTTTPHLPIHR